MIFAKKNHTETSPCHLISPLIIPYLAFFQMDRLPDPEELKFYLELEMIKDIHITNLEELGATEYKWAITGTGYSTKHIFKVIKSLEASLRQLDVILGFYQLG